MQNRLKREGYCAIVLLHLLAVRAMLGHKFFASASRYPALRLRFDCAPSLSLLATPIDAHDLRHWGSDRRRAIGADVPVPESSGEKDQHRL